MKALLAVCTFAFLAHCTFGADEAMREAQRALQILGIQDELRSTPSRIKPNQFTFSGSLLNLSIDARHKLAYLYADALSERTRGLRPARRPWGDRRAFDEHVRGLFNLLGISMEGYVIEKYTEVAEDDPNFEEKGVVEIKYESIVNGYRGCGMRLMTLDRATAKPFRVWVGAEWEYGPARIGITPAEAARIARARMVEEKADRELPSESEIEAGFDLHYVPEDVDRPDPEKDRRARLAYDLVRGNSDLVWVDAEDGRIPQPFPHVIDGAWKWGGRP